jgi:RHS repeat-associated protein
LPTILCEIDPTDSSLKKSYFYTPNGQILKQTFDDSAEPNDYFYIHDRLGSVRLVVDETGAVKNSYTTYSPFGELFTTESAETTENPFKFTGQWYDSEIRQYYLRARQYSPYLGRFTSRDPVRGRLKKPMTLHTYLYCLNDPINNVDLSGEDAKALVAPVVAGYATHDLAIAFVAFGVATNRDIAIGLGIILDQCVLEVATLAGAGVNVWDAMIHAVKQKDRDNFGRLKEIGKDYGKTLEEVRDAIHDAKTRPPYNQKGRDLTEEEIREILEETL